MADLIALNGYRVKFVGPLRDGDFWNGDHDGEPNAQSLDRLTDIQANYGPGKRFRRLNGWHIKIGTNDVRQGDYDFTTSMNRVAAIIAYLRSTFPDAKGWVSSIARIDGALDALAEPRVIPFNTGIDNVCATDALAHPSNPLGRLDPYTAVPVSPTNYVDAYHWTDTGYGLFIPQISAALEPHFVTY